VEGAVLALCVEFLHRHPLELSGLPASAVADLAALAMIREEEAAAR
jgi:hypothetical protein